MLQKIIPIRNVPDIEDLFRPSAQTPCSACSSCTPKSPWIPLKEAKTAWIQLKEAYAAATAISSENSPLMPIVYAAFEGMYLNQMGATQFLYPTMGSSGILPAVLSLLQNTYRKRFTKPHIQRFILASESYFRVLSGQHVTTSAQKAGCMAEIGFGAQAAAYATTLFILSLNTALIVTIDKRNARETAYASAILAGLLFAGKVCIPDQGKVLNPCTVGDTIAAVIALEIAQLAIKDTLSVSRDTLTKVIQYLDKQGRKMPQLMKETTDVKELLILSGYKLEKLNWNLDTLSLYLNTICNSYGSNKAHYTPFKLARNYLETIDSSHKKRSKQKPKIDVALTQIMMAATFWGPKFFTLPETLAEDFSQPFSDAFLKLKEIFESNITTISMTIADLFPAKILGLYPLPYWLIATEMINDANIPEGPAGQQEAPVILLSAEKRNHIRLAQGPSSSHAEGPLAITRTILLAYSQTHLTPITSIRITLYDGLRMKDGTGIGHGTIPAIISGIRDALDLPSDIDWEGQVSKRSLSRIQFMLDTLQIDIQDSPTSTYLQSSTTTGHPLGMAVIINNIPQPPYWSLGSGKIGTIDREVGIKEMVPARSQPKDPQPRVSY